MVRKLSCNSNLILAFCSLLISTSFSFSSIFSEDTSQRAASLTCSVVIMVSDFSEVHGVRVTQGVNGAVVGTVLISAHVCFKVSL